ncbi:Signal transduction histidine kinase [Nonomuraea solani]|uniref:histidine kinase n=1 Tax=Nonomuraea solani TaxID=1144553 RepID=A0A1H6CNX3_9ACTN|nr:histidine kinase [Nonomuraea solani]SEG74641.1 Signal transduction histidine kinase [Nonomuraea solani]
MRPGRAFLKIARFFRRPKVFDRTLLIVLALPLALLLTVARITDQTSVVPAAVHYLVGIVLLVKRRDRPILTLAMMAVADIAGLSVGAVQSLNLPTVIAFYGLGRFTSGRTTAIAAAVAYAAYATTMQLTLAGGVGWLTALFALGVPLGTGQLVRLRSELSERQRRDAADAAVRAERRRIARELHDVVAHHITVINALVGGARATLAPGQDVTRDALESAEQTARQAMAEMRGLLDVLRADGNEGPDAATGVGAERLPSLIKEARSAGLPASLTVTGEPVELPTAVDHAVYRIVQEALTNTRKHAVSAKATVLLAYGPAAVEVEVVDNGLTKQEGTPGFGLGGMAERVALCGGQLSTGPRPEGGFRVHARIPLEKA